MNEVVKILFPRRSKKKMRVLAQQQAYEMGRQVLAESLSLRGKSARSSPEKVLDALLAASVKRSSIEQMAKKNEELPSANTIRSVLKDSLELETLERELNSALLWHLSPRYWKGAQRVAADLHQQPYYGKVEGEKNVVPGQKKKSTRYFFTFATLYVVREGRRITVALHFVRKHEKPHEILRALHKHIKRSALRIGLWMADKQFNGVDCLSFFKKQALAIVPLSVRGKKSPAGGTRALSELSESQWQPYRMRRRDSKKRLELDVAVVRQKRVKEKRRSSEKNSEALLYALVGKEAESFVREKSPQRAAKIYEKRFGIESSYRQLHQGQARTSSRLPLFRLLFVGIAMLLRNLWILCCWILGAKRGPGRRKKVNDFPLEQLLSWLSDYLTEKLKYEKMLPLQAPSPLRF